MRALQILSLVCLLSARLWAGEEPPPLAPETREPEITDKMKASAEKACQFLAKSQNKRDGSLGSNYAVSATSLAGMAWLASGSTPHEGPYAENIMLALRFVVKSQSKSGFITENAANDGSMHGHGYATQFLASAYGMLRDPDFAPKVGEALEKAVHLIENTQNQYGGWNSAPNSSATDDGSGAVAIMQIAGLRTAQSCGIHVKEQVISKAKKYLADMTDQDGWYAYNWGSRSRGGGNGSAGTTGAGMYMVGAMNLQSDPKYRYDKGIKNVMATGPFIKGSHPDNGMGWNQSWWHYTCFYCTLAIFQKGGAEWARWYPALMNELIKQQKPDGSYNDSYGGVMTGLAALCMEMPYRYLPMFQEGGAGMEGR